MARYKSKVKKLCFRSILVISLMLNLSCSEEFQNRNPINQEFPQVLGESLDQKLWKLPQDIKGEPSLLILGFVQKSQFDIDRWLIGLDMRQVQVKTYEVPTINGLIPQLISDRINQGMRSGIPNFLWSGVITVYKDGEALQKFTGNVRPRNARILLLDQHGKVRFFTDEGFSVPGLNRLIQSVEDLKKVPK